MKFNSHLMTKRSIRLAFKNLLVQTVEEKPKVIHDWQFYGLLEQDVEHERKRRSRLLYGVDDYRGQRE